MAFQDPVKKLEKEIAELEELQRKDLGITDGPSSEEDGDTPAPDANVGVEPQEDSTEPVEASEAKRQTGDDEDPNSETYKSRFETLRGKYDAEVESVRSRIMLLERQNQELLRQIADVKADSSGAQQAQEPKNVEEALDELENEYGLDFAKAIDSRIERAVRQHVGNVEDRVGRVERVAEKVVQNDFYSELSRLSNNWKSLNEGNPEFERWATSQTAPFSGGKTFLQVLQDGYRMGDAVACAEVFNSFGGNSTQVGGQTKTNKQQQSATNQRPSPDHLIVPSTKGGSAPTGAGKQEGKRWTWAEVNAEYKKIELGKYPEDKAKSIEDEIYRANLEGRIVG